MGMTLVLESRPEVEFDQSWTESDGKDLIDVLLVSVGPIEKHLSLDLGPLKRIAGEEPPEDDLEEIAEMAGKSAEEILEDCREQNKTAWQAPRDLAAALHLLIGAIGDQPDKLPLAELDAYHPRAYFLEKHFLTDLKDLLCWTQAAKNAGAKQVRIFII